jgi:hypothetical protein
MSLLKVTDKPPVWAAIAFRAGEALVKTAGDAKLVYNLSGAVYLSSSGWLLMGVPNALVRGVFSAMKEPGIELPPSGDDGQLNAHVSVMRPEEIEMIGGPSKITERGKSYQYALGRMYEVEPDGWSEMSKVWFIRVHSPELQELRRSYGLSSLPNDGKYDFHITCAVRRKKVLGRNDTAKGNQD